MPNGLRAKKWEKKKRPIHKKIKESAKGIHLGVVVEDEAWSRGLWHGEAILDTHTFQLETKTKQVLRSRCRHTGKHHRKQLPQKVPREIQSLLRKSCPGGFLYHGNQRVAVLRFKQWKCRERSRKVSTRSVIVCIHYRFLTPKETITHMKIYYCRVFHFFKQKKWRSSVLKIRTRCLYYYDFLSGFAAVSRRVCRGPVLRRGWLLSGGLEVVPLCSGHHHVSKILCGILDTEAFGKCGPALSLAYFAHLFLFLLHLFLICYE